MSAVAAAVSAGVNVVGSLAGGAIASGASGRAAAAQRSAAESANKQQLYIAQQAYQERVRAAEEANRLVNASYDVARPELTGGYTTSANILGETYGTPARAAIAASGTSPDQLRQLQQARDAIAQPYQAAGQKIAQLMAQLNSIHYEPALEPQITALQQQVQEATRQQAALKPQLDAAEQALAGAQPYVPGQAAQAATVGRAPQALISAADKTTSLLNAGYDAATTQINAGYDQAGNYITIGYDQAGQLIKTGYDQAGKIIQKGYVQAAELLNKGINAAIDYQKPYYETGVRALGTMEKMITPGNEYLPQDPGYQFRLEQGNQAINNSAATRGNLLSGATLKAIDTYSSGLASQEFQNAFQRWNELATKGQTASQTMSGLEQGRGTGLANLETGKADNLSNLATGRATNLANLSTGRGSAMANLATGRATNLAGLSTERGINLGNVSSNLGNNLSTLYGRYGDTMSDNAINQGNALSNLTLNQGNYLANNALGNADFYNQSLGAVGRDVAGRTVDAGDATAAGIVGGANAMNRGFGNAANALMQELNLYGGQRQSGYNPDGSYYNNRYIP